MYFFLSQQIIPKVKGPARLLSQRLSPFFHIIHRVKLKIGDNLDVLMGIMKRFLLYQQLVDNVERLLFFRLYRAFKPFFCRLRNIFIAYNGLSLLRGPFFL